MIRRAIPFFVVPLTVVVGVSLVQGQTAAPPAAPAAQAQPAKDSGGAFPAVASREAVIRYTPKWTGERLEDGRPKISEALLARLKNVPIVDAWSACNAGGYRNNYTTGIGWTVMWPDQAIIGRVLTAQYMPTNPDVNAAIMAQGRADGRIGNSNSWPIDMLKKGDVYVADGFGKIAEGTLIGDNLGNAIFANSGNGVIFDGSVRDWEGLQAIKGFNAWVRGSHPSAIGNMMLTGINVPIRIGDAVATPGDVVLARPEGIVFIPPHLVESMVTNSERTLLRDTFGHLRLQEKKYTPGQIDSGWTAEINADYRAWLQANIDKLPVPREAVEAVLNAPAAPAGGRGGGGGGRGAGGGAGGAGRGGGGGAGAGQ
jgi:regulator of RNase E activity RraA